MFSPRDRRMLQQIAKGIAMLQEEIDNLEVKVTDIEGGVDSAIALLGELAALIRDAADDPAEVRSIADRIEARKVALAEAVEANRPVPPV
jgi:hypothetical protein